MPDTVADRLFSLFTSPDRAQAMAGDLAEERQRRGWLWFWFHVVRVTLALWRSAVMDAPMRVLALTLAGCALLTAPVFAGAAAVGLFPQLMGTLVSWAALSFFWWGGALWTGASLVAVAPRRGMAACATLAAAGAAVLIPVGVTAVWRDALKTDFLLFYTIGLLGTAPLLIGGTIARRRLIAFRTPAEPHR